MLLAIAVAMTLALLAWTFLIRPQDLPQTEPPVPWHHLDGRKAAIYENLRDLQFEYRVGKLSDEDYQRSKQELQAELATVLAEIDGLKNGTAAAPKQSAAAVVDPNTCQSCGARFEKPLKFCGECGKPMGGSA
jgi:hypothetical protein